MKKVLFGLMACATLLAVSCESNDTADDDSLYQTHSVDKKEAAKRVRA